MESGLPVMRLMFQLRRAFVRRSLDLLLVYGLVFLDFNLRNLNRKDRKEHKDFNDKTEMGDGRCFDREIHEKRERSRLAIWASREQRPTAIFHLLSPISFAIFALPPR